MIDTNINWVDGWGRLKTNNIGPLGAENLITPNFDYLGRLQTLTHFANGINPASVLSKFDHTHQPDGNIATWQRQFGGDPATKFTLGYDRVDQLTTATLALVAAPATVTKRYSYQYDSAANRSSQQAGSLINTATSDSADRITAQTGGGKLFVSGNTDELSKVKVNGQPATQPLHHRKTSIKRGLQLRPGQIPSPSKKPTTPPYRIPAPKAGTSTSPAAPPAASPMMAMATRSATASAPTNGTPKTGWLESPKAQTSMSLFTMGISAVSQKNLTAQSPNASSGTAPKSPNNAIPPAPPSNANTIAKEKNA
jgi:hypothetical protein